MIVGFPPPRRAEAALAELEPLPDLGQVMQHVGAVLTPDIGLLGVEAV
eukprot:CAMPEP_0198213396 /NCGR_PEP_ID=MMETSP1445-20131203/28844_1 /TAXON_ID=36898 /ORGANISM="Pyramimonas sp., Strain CCMP2087" /LENGTH=47 /DNA_ID= /DNA_START= /DNA_END= /DNA_ORIENTATION=